MTAVSSATLGNNFIMSLKYRRSPIFDKPNSTTLQLALQTILHDCKERLQLNSRSKSRVLHPNDSVERLNVRQVRTIENLASKVPSVSFHQVYSSYQLGNSRKEEPSTIDPDKMKRFKSGQSFKNQTSQISSRTSQKREGIRRSELEEYYQRMPEE